MAHLFIPRAIVPGPKSVRKSGIRGRSAAGRDRRGRSKSSASRYPQVCGFESVQFSTGSPRLHAKPDEISPIATARLTSQRLIDSANQPCKMVAVRARLTEKGLNRRANQHRLSQCLAVGWGRREKVPFCLYLVWWCSFAHFSASFSSVMAAWICSMAFTL
jgi:hypothetical protein